MLLFYTKDGDDGIIRQDTEEEGDGSPVQTPPAFFGNHVPRACKRGRPARGRSAHLRGHDVQRDPHHSGQGGNRNSDPDLQSLVHNDPCQPLSVLVVVVFFLTLVNSQGAKVIDCTPPSAPAKIENVTLIPDPPSTGTNHIITIGYLSETVTASTYYLDVKLGGSNIVNRVHSMCGNDSFKLPLGLGSVQVEGLTCPEGPGQVRLVQTLNLLGSLSNMIQKLASHFHVDPIPEIPLETVSVSFNSTDQNNGPLFCLQVIVS